MPAEPKEKAAEPMPAKPEAKPAVSPDDTPAAPMAPRATNEPNLDMLAPPVKSQGGVAPLPSTTPEMPREKEVVPTEPKKMLQLPAASPDSIPALPKSSDRGATEMTTDAGFAVADVGEQRAPALQANWDAALQPESLKHGNLQVADRVELSAVDPTAAASAPAEIAAPTNLAMDGYCPVQLAEQERWVHGDARYAVQYGGRTYLLTGAAEQQKFAAAPQHYVPAYAGNDPVLEVEEAKKAPGKTQHSAICNGRLFLFSSAETLRQFQGDPGRYAQRGPKD